MKKLILIISVLFAFVNLSRAVHEPPQRRKVSEIKKILAESAKADCANAQLDEINIVLVAKDTTYGPLSHQYLCWQKKWSNLLTGKSQNNLNCNMYQPTVAEMGDSKVKISDAYHWPSDEQFKNADVVVFYCYVDWNKQRFDRLEKYVCAGGGLVFLHNTVWTTDARLADIIGLTFIFDKSKWQEGPLSLNLDASKDICLAMPATIDFCDEVYYQGVGRKNIEVIASWQHKAGDGKEVSWPMVWKYNNGSGRVFVNMIGHYRWTFDDPLFRIITLRGIAWAAKQKNIYRFDSLALIDSWSE
ncbi:MAG: ThuA domain-containing protein [Planctomycetes bacterium]|nr:ThuA domain-containing protein [Planctomycetota bacterium]